MGNCTWCALANVGLSNCIGGRGNGKVLLVGQNPGTQEDFAEEAFVGRSGKALASMLADAGFVQSDVRWTNAVRCLTPDNRTPLPAERLACLPHLVDEVRATRPQVIVALGEVALRSLTGMTASMRRARGQALELHKSFEYDCPVFATYHPAFVLRAPQAKNIVIADLRRVRDRATAQTPVPPWELVTDYPVPPAAHNGTAKVFSYDIETFDAEGKITENVTQLAVAGEEGPVLVARGEAIQHLIAWLRQHERSGRIILSGHNSWDFDDLKTGLASRIDTMALAFLDDETQPLGLEALCVKYLGVHGWKEDRVALLGSDELVDYNARDAKIQRDLTLHLLERVGPRGRRLMDLLRRAWLALREASARGTWIDGTEVEKERATQEARIAEALTQLDVELQRIGFPADAFDVELKTRTKRVPFNPGSNLHVARVLEFLGYDLPRTDTGLAKVDHETLSRIGNEPFATALEAWRAASKRMSTYVVKFAKFAAEGDGAIHPDYTVLRVPSRSSATKNYQNLDRELQPRYFSAPPGQCLVSCDYSSIEFRLGAVIAREQVILDNYARDPAWDPHTWFAARVNNIPEADVTKSQRQEAKSANFSQEYLGTCETLRSYMQRVVGVAISRDRAIALHRTWHAAFPGWIPWYMRTKEELIAHGYVETLTGMRRHFGPIDWMNPATRRAALREACNFKVQCLAWHFAAIGLDRIRRARLPLAGFVHDDFKFWFATEAEARAAEPTIRRAVVDEPLAIMQSTFGVAIDVPITVELKYKIG